MSLLPTDPALLSLLQKTAGGEEAWGRFHDGYGPVIFAWCRRGGLPHDDAGDLEQDILIKLFIKLREGAYDPQQGRFRSWLKAVVRNAVADWWRQRQRQPEPGGVGGTGFQELLANLQSPEAIEELSNSLDARAKTVEAEAFARARAQVEEKTWQAFYQTLVEGRPACEVAEELGLKISSVYKYTHRVKLLLEQEYRHVLPSNGPRAEVPGRNDPQTLPG